MLNPLLEGHTPTPRNVCWTRLKRPNFLRFCNSLSLFSRDCSPLPYSRLPSFLHRFPFHANWGCLTYTMLFVPGTLPFCSFLSYESQHYLFAKYLSHLHAHLSSTCKFRTCRWQFSTTKPLLRLHRKRSPTRKATYIQYRVTLPAAVGLPRWWPLWFMSHNIS